MIIRDRPSGLKLLLLLRGSVLPRILPTLLLNIAIATFVTWSHGDLWDLKITLTTIPFTLIGLPLAIFLGFRSAGSRTTCRSTPSAAPSKSTCAKRCATSTCRRRSSRSIIS
jgi:predicted membrane chloride channel (bestrophin family)